LSKRLVKPLNVMTTIMTKETKSLPPPKLVALIRSLHRLPNRLPLLRNLLLNPVADLRRRLTQPSHQPLLQLVERPKKSKTASLRSRNLKNQKETMAKNVSPV